MPKSEDLAYSRTNSNSNVTVIPTISLQFLKVKGNIV